jgi:hypothetical protein
VVYRKCPRGKGTRMFLNKRSGRRHMSTTRPIKACIVVTTAKRTGMMLLSDIGQNESYATMKLPAKQLDRPRKIIQRLSRFALNDLAPLSATATMQTRPVQPGPTYWPTRGAHMKRGQSVTLQSCCCCTMEQHSSIALSYSDMMVLACIMFYFCLSVTHTLALTGLLTQTDHLVEK